MVGQLMAHCGAELVTRHELEAIAAPEGTQTWHPIAHHTVLQTVEQMLDTSGLCARTSSLAVSHRGLRFFGVLDIEAPLVEGVSLSVGIRNSNDRQFPIGFGVGNRTFVCDNLAFSADIVISKRHTRFGRERFNEGVANAVQTLSDYRQVEAQRIRTLQNSELTDDQASAVILRAWEKRVIGQRQVLPLLREWRSPSYEAFEERTCWSLLSAFTHVMKERQNRYPNRAAAEVMRFQSLLPI